MAIGNQIKATEFEETKNKFIKATQEIESSLKRIEELMKPIDGNNENWSGKTAKAVVEKYDEFRDNFDEINSKLADYGSYLNKTLENYTNAMAKSEATIARTEDNFNVS